MNHKCVSGCTVKGLVPTCMPCVSKGMFVCVRLYNKKKNYVNICQTKGKCILFHYTRDRPRLFDCVCYVSFLFVTFVDPSNDRCFTHIFSICRNELDKKKESGGFLGRSSLISDGNSKNNKCRQLFQATRSLLNFLIEDFFSLQNALPCSVLYF